MSYHPETLAFSFPPYPKEGAVERADRPYRWSLGRALYALKPWVGFDIWHIDPERRTEGQRTDDSCGWFDRRPGPYSDALKELLADKGDMQDLANTFANKVFWRSAYLDEYPANARGWDRLMPAEAWAAAQMIAMRLERLRWHHASRRAAWFARPFIRERQVMVIAANLALNPTDNLASCETPESMARSIASALHRRFRPWWRHPRWHVHHWKVNFDLLRNLRRMAQPCATCRQPLGFGYCPVADGRGLHHSACLSGSVGQAQK